MSHEQIANDLHRKMVEHLQEWLDREFALAAMVLPASELALILISLASGQLSTAAATIANMAEPTADPEKLYDDVVRAAIARAQATKPQAMKRVAEARKARSS